MSPGFALRSEYLPPATQSQLQLEQESPGGWFPLGRDAKSGWMRLCEESMAPRLVRALLAMGDAPWDLLPRSDCDFLGWQKQPSVVRPCTRVLVDFGPGTCPFVYLRRNPPPEGAWFTWFPTGRASSGRKLQNQANGPSAGLRLAERAVGDGRLWLVSGTRNGPDDERKEECLKGGKVALATHTGIEDGGLRYDARFNSHVWVDFAVFTLQAFMSGHETARQLPPSAQVEIFIPIIRRGARSLLETLPPSSSAAVRKRVAAHVGQLLRELAPQKLGKSRRGHCSSLIFIEPGATAIVWHGPALIAFERFPLPAHSAILFTKYGIYKHCQLYGFSRSATQHFGTLGTRTVYSVRRKAVGDLQQKLVHGRQQLVAKNKGATRTLGIRSFAEAHVLACLDDIPSWQRCGPSDMFDPPAIKLLVLRIDTDVDTDGSFFQGPQSFRLTIRERLLAPCRDFVTESKPLQAVLADFSPVEMSQDVPESEESDQ